MEKLHKKHKRLLVNQVSKWLIFVMFLSLIIPTNITAAQVMNNKQQVKVEDKIDTKLSKAYKEEENVKYIVILEDQTDTEEIANNAKESAEQNSLSQVKTKEKIQKAVVSELQSNAKATQKDLISYLKKDTKNIKAYNSFFIVNAVAVTGTEESAEEIARLPEVKSVILDEKQKLLPIEKNKSELTDDEIEWNIDRIGAPDVWETGVTGENTVVANIDSGVEGNHPALKRQYRGYNPDDPENPSHEFNWYDAVSGRLSPMDSDGHGTHTMGTMVGQEEDGQNKIGVAPGAKWISTRAFFAGEGYDSYILDAAEWVLAPTDKNGVPHPEKAPDVVNNSWGGSPINNDWFLPMVQAWRNAGIVPVFSVGNAGFFDDSDPGSASAPANYDEAIAVGATDENDELASFSLRGPSENGTIKPDISAPGVNIRSSWPGETWDQFEYEQSNGTSMAAPHVAATVLLMKQVDDSLTVDQIENTLKLTAVNKTDDAYPDYPNNGYGYGSLDAKAAVDAVEQGIGTVEGQVITAGNDSEAPTFEHDARQLVFKGMDENFSIRAMDNVSVDRVTLHILNDDGAEETHQAARVDGDYLDGVYEVEVPKEDIIGESLQYWWTIDDFSGNRTKSDVYEVDIRLGVEPGYVEDFEGYPDGWYSYGTNNSWEWGVPEFGPDKAASGEKVMGTDLRGKYEVNSDMTLVMPPVIVDDHTTLRFKNWYNLSFYGRDTGTVFASLDGENWDPLHQVRQSNERWHEIGIDLSEYAGEKIYIAFNLQTADYQEAGWYIDDVQLVESASKSSVTNELMDKDISLTGPTKADKVFPQSIEKHNRSAAETAALPVEATIQVEETGWETETASQNGKFVIHHPAGEYTLHIDAYGFEQATETVKVSEKGMESPRITLDPLEKQKVYGKIKNASGDVIKDATIFLLEDEKVKPVHSKADGTYELEAYDGTYTLKVFAAGYYGKAETISVESGEVLHDVTLEPFNSAEASEIKYDNGSYGKNLAFGKKGNGFAVKMSLDGEQGPAMLTSAKLQFWADHIPVPGGDDIILSIYDAKGPDGAPGNKLAGPIDAKAKRDLYSWTEVDLSELGLVVDGDFYIAYLQAADYPYVPGFVSDGDAQNAAGRSWDYIGGQWFQANEDLGNYMIRAVVDYGETAEVAEPVITSPVNGGITNEENITVEGSASPAATIQLMNNGEEVVKESVSDTGEFAIPMTLLEGENELTVVTLVDESPVNESDAVTITLDTEAPALTIDSPQDGDVIKEKTITVEGAIRDDHLDVVEVNGQQATIEDGAYSKQIQLENGEQVIEVVARDEAGNITSESVTIQVKSDDGLAIENLTPTDDVYIETGESVKLTFDSEPGLRATFVIHMPLTNLLAKFTYATELPLMETSDGHYVGYYTATKNAYAEGAVIEVKVTDEYGNQVRALADGKLFINVE